MTRAALSVRTSILYPTPSITPPFLFPFPFLFSLPTKPPIHKQTNKPPTPLLPPDYQNPPSFNHTLFTSSTPSDPSYDLALGPYRKYSPCQLLLQDPSGSSGESVTSVAIFISQATNASTEGVTWSADDPAPKVAVDAGVGTVNSRGARAMDRKAAVGGVMWVLAGAVAGGVVFL